MCVNRKCMIVLSNTKVQSHGERYVITKFYLNYAYLRWPQVVYLMQIEK